MKQISKIGLSLVAMAFITVTGFANSKQSVSDESIGLRKTSVDAEDIVKPSVTKYGKAAPGTSHKIKRAFQDAPPMVPHDVEGMLPITVNDNQCISCHMPEVAASMGATPVPKSHFTNFRPLPKYDGQTFDKTVDDMKNETAIKEQETLVNARFNCSQCHAPQSEGELVKNNFKAVYTKKDGANKSSWSGSKLTEGLDTLNDK
ncbi:MAG: nitrate reductase cytochrome c-type subunit [Arcobacteraceae bacterium]|jgi:cytochrome c-type protein NapB|nr:nitrate reductase cytochrome c-type subunit [Arcobacteraceae bacterium]